MKRKGNELVEEYENDSNIEIPQEVYDFLNEEQVDRAREDIKQFEMYTKHVEDFSRDWELYDEHGEYKIYNKPHFEDDVTSFTFGGD